MKSILYSVLFLSSLLTLSAWGSESYLYWRIDEFAAEDPIPFYYAGLKDEKGTLIGNTLYESNEDRLTTNPYHTLLSSDSLSSESSFLFELLSSDFEVIGQSGVYSYQDIQNYVFSGYGFTGEAPLVVTGFVVPEPSTGLLALCGLALLALKRRRA